MKRLPLVIALGAMLASPIGFAQQDADEHAAHHPQEQAAAPGSPSEHDHAQGSKLQQNTKKMQALMAQIMETQDPKLRSELLQQHLQAMRDQIKMMRKMAGMKMDMKGGGAMGGDSKGDAMDADGKGDKKDGMMEGKKGGMMGGGMMMMHKKMEQRLDMLEQMLEQMVEHEAAEQSIESK
jgi:hypothetical protein